MPKQKLKWTDTEDIAFRLIDEYPTLDPLRVRFTDLHRYITSLPDFGDNPKKSTESVLEGIQMRWLEERRDMEDDLGPVQAASEDDDELDEDDYRDDEMVEDGDLAAGLDDDDDDEEDELGDGFQEEDPDGE